MMGDFLPAPISRFSILYYHFRKIFFLSVKEEKVSAGLRFLPCAVHKHCQDNGLSPEGGTELLR